MTLPLTCARAGTRAGGRGPALSGAGLWLQSRRLKKDARGSGREVGRGERRRVWRGSVNASVPALVRTECGQERGGRGRGAGVG